MDKNHTRLDQERSAKYQTATNDIHSSKKGYQFAVVVLSLYKDNSENDRTNNKLWYIKLTQETISS